MRKGPENPDAATYLSVLSACGHTRLLEDGLAVFNQMVKDIRSGLEKIIVDALSTC